ncbi:MAG: peptidoglycan DD-metalloendopeptidase family protein [Bacteroidales bacterium]|nr:peptidoglycan DD-metalloendopeptidase family protein [Bacteroidales bacterium]
MNNFIIHIAEASILLSVFHLIYYFLLRKSKAFSFNRYYILGTMLLASLLPFLNFNLLTNKNLISSLNAFRMEEIFNHVEYSENIKSAINYQYADAIHFDSFIWLFYITGLVIVLCNTLIQLYKLIKLINQHEFHSQGKLKITYTELKHAPFSFLSYIFLNKENCSGQQFHQILEHEKQHVTHKHSIDLIIHAIVSILHWFNPFIYAMRRSLREIHEYQADQELILQGNDRLNYQKILLNQVEMNLSNPMISSFNYSLTKKRIIMMNTYNHKPFFWKATVVVSITVIVSLISVLNINSNPAQAMIITPPVVSAMDMIEEIPEQFSPISKTEMNKISAAYGKMKDPISKKMKMHNGVDISAPKGTSVHAYCSGTTRKVSADKNRGKYIIIDHADGYSSLYSHLSKILVTEGEIVEGNKTIGKVGSTGRSTGPHLHFEIMKDGENIDPATLIESLKK